MSETQVTHTENWHIRITPSDGESWPDTHVPGPKDGQTVRPRSISVEMYRGDDGPRSVKLHSIRLNSRGEQTNVPLALRASQIGWVAEEVTKARTRLHLGPGATGVGW